MPLALAKEGLKQNELPHNRRRQLLLLQSQLLVADVQALLRQWRQRGLLETAFEQLPATQKITLFHDSTIAFLAHLRQLLTQDNGHNITLDAFAGKRRQNMAHSLTTIKAMYFSLPNQTRDLSLANVFFSSEQQQQIQDIIISTDQNLNSGQSTTLTKAIVSLNTLIDVFSSAIDNGLHNVD